MTGRFVAMAAVAIFGLIAQTGWAAMYKWVDERGVVHYGDRLPTQGSSTSAQFSRATGTAKSVQQPVVMTTEDVERQKAEAKRRLMQERQDAALIATYSNENEIDAARERELKRHQETLKVATDGLAGSNDPDDKRKLNQLLNQGQQATDAINAKYHAQKLRFRELKGASTVAQAASGKSEGQGRGSKD